MYDTDLTDIEIKAIYYMTAIIQCSPRGDAMTKSAVKVMNDITPKPPNNCLLQDLWAWI